MATLSVQTADRTGVDLSYVAVASQDQFLNDGKTVIMVKNGGGSADVVTISGQKTCSHGDAHNISKSVAMTSGHTMLGPFPKDIYNDANGYVKVNHSFTTSVTIAVVSLE